MTALETAKSSININLDSLIHFYKGGKLRRARAIKKGQVAAVKLETA